MDYGSNTLMSLTRLCSITNAVLVITYYTYARIDLLGPLPDLSLFRSIIIYIYHYSDLLIN